MEALHAQPRQGGHLIILFECSTASACLLLRCSQAAALSRQCTATSLPEAASAHAATCSRSQCHFHVQEKQPCIKHSDCSRCVGLWAGVLGGVQGPLLPSPCLPCIPAHLLAAQDPTTTCALACAIPNPASLPPSPLPLLQWPVLQRLHAALPGPQRRQHQELPRLAALRRRLQLRHHPQPVSKAGRLVQTFVPQTLVLGAESCHRVHPQSAQSFSVRTHPFQSHPNPLHQVLCGAPHG